MMPSVIRKIVEVESVAKCGSEKNRVLRGLQTHLKTGRKAECRLMIGAWHSAVTQSTPATADRPVYMPGSNMADITIQQTELMQGFCRFRGQTHAIQ